jgi:acetate kinase
MMKQPVTILCLNSGSSSLKFSAYEIQRSEEQLLFKGAIENIGLDNGVFWCRKNDKQELAHESVYAVDHSNAMRLLFERLAQSGLAQADAIAHRVVHGGSTYQQATWIDDTVLHEITRLQSYAPLHMPAAIACIEATRKQFSHVPQAACFDTAFFSEMPRVAQQFALPYTLFDQGIRRYGFHGLSYQYIVEELDGAQSQRLVVAHLGNGASMAAIKNGTPLDTSMGFTPTGGLMMGTRCGDLDPSVLLHFMRNKDYDVDQLDDIVNKQSGLLGVSGLSSDVKTLLENADNNTRARQALDMFCYQAKKTIGAYTAVLGGIDLLVFTAGIGERSAIIRQQICDGLQYLGVEIDTARNNANEEIISTPASVCTVRVMPTNEDLVMARQVYRMITVDRS